MFNTFAKEFQSNEEKLTKKKLCISDVKYLCWAGCSVSHTHWSDMKSILQRRAPPSASLWRTILTAASTMTPNTPQSFATTTRRPKRSRECWLSWTFLHSQLTSILLKIYGGHWPKPSIPDIRRSSLKHCQITQGLEGLSAFVKTGGFQAPSGLLSIKVTSGWHCSHIHVWISLSSKLNRSDFTVFSNNTDTPSGSPEQTAVIWFEFL